MVVTIIAYGELCQTALFLSGPWGAHDLLYQEHLLLRLVGSQEVIVAQQRQDMSELRGTDYQTWVLDKGLHVFGPRFVEVGLLQQVHKTLGCHHLVVQDRTHCHEF